MEDVFFPMMVQHAYVVNAIERNDADAIENLLECMCPKEYDGKLPANNVFTIVLMLEYASASDGAMLLSERIADLLIDYLAMRTSFGDFLSLFLRRCHLTYQCGPEILGPNIVELFESSGVPYSNEVIEAIEQLSKDQFISLMGYILDKSDSETGSFIMDGRLFATIVHYICNQGLIPRECVLAYMRMCL